MQILDHGYLRFVEAWGTGDDGKIANDFEVGIIEAARMSTDKGFLGWEPHCNKCGYGDLISTIGNGCPFCSGKIIVGDENLLAHLYNNKHATPFEMAGLIIEVKAPIFIFREWHRHRTQSYNEMSARYIPLPDENYIPSIERCRSGANTATTNKQAQNNGTILTTDNAYLWLAELGYLYEQAQKVYDLGMSVGIPKELARLPVPVARYSKMRASANLRNWLAFLTLRQAPQAQWEIREYANAVGTLIADRFPRTWELCSKP
jgi:thymidylate synthase (FAD)